MNESLEQLSLDVRKLMERLWTNDEAERVEGDDNEDDLKGLEEDETLYPPEVKDNAFPDLEKVVCQHPSVPGAA